MITVSTVLTQEEIPEEGGKKIVIKVFEFLICPFCTVEYISNCKHFHENDDSQGLTQYLDQNKEWKQLHLVTTREMQLTLKMVMNKIDVQNFD